MFDSITKLKKSKKDSTKAVTMLSPTVVLYALCAHRDKLIVRQDRETPEVLTQLLFINTEIKNLTDQIR